MHPLQDPGCLVALPDHDRAVATRHLETVAGLLDRALVQPGQQAQGVDQPALTGFAEIQQFMPVYRPVGLGEDFAGIIVENQLRMETLEQVELLHAPDRLEGIGFAQHDDKFIVEP